MCVEDAVNLLDAFTQGLLAKVGCGINQDLMTGPFEQRTAPGAFIARLR
jgi:hypothetical protein